jgi:hypothetical protein
VQARSQNAFYVLHVQLHASMVRLPGAQGILAKTEASAVVLDARTCGDIKQWAPQTTERPFKVRYHKEVRTQLKTLERSLRHAFRGDEQDKGLIWTSERWKFE